MENKQNLIRLLRGFCVEYGLTYTTYTHWFLKVLENGIETSKEENDCLLLYLKRCLICEKEDFCMYSGCVGVNLTHTWNTIQDLRKAIRLLETLN